MAEICRDIDQGLAALNRKIDDQNKKIRELERNLKKCCDPGASKTPDQKTSLKEILKRLDELEKIQEALKTGIIESLNNFADIENTNQDFIQAFQGLHEMITPLVGIVSEVIGFLGDDE
ncbi:hypothetical protein [Nostoc sp.]|uniref:hypothetical protein n=1 Tax=Nostoc sp. TaxID=1180 RepID=UPI003593461A